MEEADKLALTHAWNHFQLHAQQRITVFNFFVATASLLVTGIAYTLQASRDAWPFGVTAGILLLLLSFVFRKLDRRVSSIIKSSEQVIVAAEARLFGDPALRTVSCEGEMTKRTHFGMFSAWTYGRSFRFIFGLMGIVGIGAVVLSASRAPLPTIQVAWPAPRP